jgi:hypothetical protein
MKRQEFAPARDESENNTVNDYIGKPRSVNRAPIGQRLRMLSLTFEN